MEFSGLSVIEVRNPVSCAVGYAYLGNGFLCTLCVLENSGPRHGRKRNKKPGPWVRFWLPNGKHWKPWKTSGSPKSRAVFFFFFFTQIWPLMHWPIKIGRKPKTAQLWMESLYAPLWPECLYAYPVGKIFNARQANWQIRSSSHAEKRSCQPENWLSIGKNGFLTELKRIWSCKLGPFCVKFHLGQSRKNPLL